MRACVHVCVLSEPKRGAASTNITTSVFRACPELKPLAPKIDVQPIKLTGQVLRMISIKDVRWLQLFIQTFFLTFLFRFKNI